jgi:hypothetical protein
MAGLPEAIPHAGSMSGTTVRRTPAVDPAAPTGHRVLAPDTEPNVAKFQAEGHEAVKIGRGARVTLRRKSPMFTRFAP